MSRVTYSSISSCLASSESIWILWVLVHSTGGDHDDTQVMYSLSAYQIAQIAPPTSRQDIPRNHLLFGLGSLPPYCCMTQVFVGSCRASKYKYDYPLPALLRTITYTMYKRYNTFTSSIFLPFILRGTRWQRMIKAQTIGTSTVIDIAT